MRNIPLRRPGFEAIVIIGAANRTGLFGAVNTLGSVSVLLETVQHATSTGRARVIKQTIHTLSRQAG